MFQYPQVRGGALVALFFLPAGRIAYVDFLVSFFRAPEISSPSQTWFYAILSKKISLGTTWSLECLSLPAFEELPSSISVENKVDFGYLQP